MTNLINNLKDAEALAREWLKFSQEAYGWQCRDYGDDTVDCYFAVSSKHRAVRLGNIACCISIGFHTPVKFSDLTHQSAAKLPEILAATSALLESERELLAERSVAEAEALKANRLAQLRRELAALESGQESEAV